MSMIQVYGHDGRLEFNGKTYRCAVGSGGVVDVDKKVEGDGATPAGSYLLRKVHYRPDRFGKSPITQLPMRAMTPNDGWCDDEEHPEAYNRFVTLPYSGSHEELWRDDHLYDIVAEIGYNDAPAVPGKGSAIFMHVARKTYSPTAGCVALALPDLMEVLRQIEPDTRIEINA